jgi:hypothetical protein
MRKDFLLMKAIFSGSFLFALFSIAFPASATTYYYVSPTGNDSNGTGAIYAPFATITKARDIVRTLIAKGLKDSVSVQLRGGTYRLAVPLVLTADDSGNQAYPVTYTSYRGETATITGSRVVSGFTTWSGNIKRVADSGTFNSLFANGKRQIRARYPNYDPIYPYTKGFLTMRRGTEMPTLQASTNTGETIDWLVNLPTTDTYYIWIAYAGITEFSNKTGLTVDGGAESFLDNMHSSGSLNTYVWSNVAGTPTPAATKMISAGTHRIQRLNHGNANYGIAAIILTNDKNWTPKSVHFPLPKPALGKILVYIDPSKFTAATRLVSGTGTGTHCFGYTGSANIPAGIKTVFPYADQDVKPEWANDPNATVNLWTSLGYYAEIVKLSSIDPYDKTVTVSGHETTHDLQIGRKYFVENILSELDIPGEWYLDTSGGYLYYWPVNNSYTVTVSATGKLITSSGGLKYVNFDRLKFTESDWSQADGCDGYCIDPAGVIDLTNATHCKIKNSVFDQNGKFAVRLNGGSENGVSNCVITNSGTGGINLQNAVNTYVSGNTIHDIGFIYKHAVGILSRGNLSNGNIVSYNTVYNAPRMGIRFQVADNDGGVGPVVRYNHVHDVCLDTEDCGGIYFYQNSKTNNFRKPAEVFGNTIYNVYGYSWMFGHLNMHANGMYIDGFSSGINVSYNLIYNVAGTGLFLQGGRDIKTWHNTIANNAASQAAFTNFDDNSANNSFQYSIAYAPDNPNWTIYVPFNAELKTDFDYNIYMPKGNNNGAIFYSNILGYKNISQWRAITGETHSSKTDPLFISSSNFQLRANSPAIDAGDSSDADRDLAGNPIYGPPDIGAFEYQPPLVMGYDTITTPIRVYGDGKFRTIGNVCSYNAHFSVIPQGHDTKKYLDISISTWNSDGDFKKEWTEHSPNLGSTPIDHSVGNLQPGKYYAIKVDGSLAAKTISGPACINGICLADSNGKIIFTYLGGSSTHTFSVVDAN